MITYGIAILCVLGLAIGQILFKISAAALTESGSFFSAKPTTILFAAMCLYGVISVAWVWLLQKIELGRIYPLMALAFVLVPLGSNLVFGERFEPQYFVGVAIIMVGIYIAVSA